MIYRRPDSNAFEFAVVAGLRAKQLMAGCAPRVVPALTCTRTASLEVRAGKVARIALASAVATDPSQGTT